MKKLLILISIILVSCQSDELPNEVTDTIASEKDSAAERKAELIFLMEIGNTPAMAEAKLDSLTNKNKKNE